MGKWCQSLKAAEKKVEDAPSADLATGLIPFPTFLRKSFRSNLFAIGTAIANCAETARASRHHHEEKGRKPCFCQKGRQQEGQDQYASFPASSVSWLDWMLTMRPSHKSRRCKEALPQGPFRRLCPGVIYQRIRRILALQTCCHPQAGR